MTGRLFAVGIGPGDPELLTLKAARVLREVPCIFVPKGREEGSSLALSIVQKVISLDGKEVVEAYFPMVKTMGGQEPGAGNREKSEAKDRNELDSKWDKVVDEVLNRLDRGTDAAFITVGDPAVYSTFFYLYDRLLARRPALVIEVVPGISSINAAAALAGLSLGLGNERIAVLPANYMENLQKTLETFNTVVLMKVNKVFDEVKNTIIRAGLANNAVYIARVGMDDERVLRNIDSVRTEDLNYFSILIVRKR